MLYADGGALVLQKQTADFIVSAFASPVPPRAGIADISVLVQSAADRKFILDAEVTVTVSAPGKPAFVLAATRAQARNKLLYAATVNFTTGGDWSLKITCNQGGRSLTGLTRLTVLPAPPTPIRYWPYFAIIPVMIAFFTLNQWLKAKRNVKSPRAQP